MRMASTPNLSNMSMGSTPLFRDFDIGLPSLPRTVPVTTTSSNGFLPVNLSVSITIRETHRKMMSRPVTSTSVGKNVLKSGVSVISPFQPKVENAHRPDENHVSSTS